MTAPQLVWFRQDLRTADQPALRAAAERGPVVGLYVLDDEAPGEWRMGGASRWWLHHSLAALGRELEKLGSALILRRGPSAATVRAVAQELRAGGIHATHHYEPWWREAEEAHGHFCIVHGGDVLHEPAALRSGSGGPFKIFGPYYRKLEAHLPPPEPLPAPRLSRPDKLPPSDRLEDWHLLPTAPDWSAGFEIWQPGEAGAAAHLARFADDANLYARRRDLPSEVGTSNLSAHLHFGELSPRQLWHGIHGAACDKFHRELAWRDFSRGVILADPEAGSREQRPLGLANRTGPAADRDFAAWSKGRTGYPIVDAGMRQLWDSGWMHNRVRLITASFLVKHLLVDWQRGAKWFWDTLVDADYANNSQNWQWIAGTGFDSQPYYRVMAPLIQSDKFAAADYIRRWVPELASLSDAAIHDPDPMARRAAGYPEPLIGHREARDRALAAYRERG